MKKVFLLICFLIVSFSVFPNNSFAQEDQLSPAITVINLIRGNDLGHEKDDITSSLKDQWQVTKDAKVNATWLMQYGALEKKSITDFAKYKMPHQEFGLLFEIDRNFAEKSKVQFKSQGPWYFSDGLFLNSYDQAERQKLIDTAFSKFKSIFGYYPKTVGAWWIGGDSLSYMQRKYGITSALRASDQFDLDYYSIWGTPWNIPYLSSKNNQGMPANSLNESSKVVILQWAARDPLRGYLDATFSLQDYPIKGYKSNYVNYLSSIFLEKPLGNLVVGLENGGNIETFGTFYKPMLAKAKELEKDNSVNILLAKDYAQKFLDQGKVFANKPYFLSKDYNSDDQSFWYISENFRVGIQKNKDNIHVIDIRDYSIKSEEDFTILPNTQPHLRINEPGTIDSMRFPTEKILVRTSKELITTKEKGEGVELYVGKEKIAYFTPLSFKLFMDNNNIKEFTFDNKKSQINPLNILIGLYVLYFLIIFITRKKDKKILKNFLPLLVPFFFASSSLISGSTFLFDKKEVLLLNLLSYFNFSSILTTITLFKIIPFFILIILHYIFVIRSPGKLKKYFYLTFLVIISFLYFHIPYFPLDRTTFSFVIAMFGLTTIVLIVLAIFIFIKFKTKKTLIILLISIPIILLSLAFTTLFSRSKFALTSFEINALQTIKDGKKNVLYVQQVNYSVKPIYKAVKPLIYDNYSYAEKLTGKNWQAVMRPTNHILKISNYENKLIVIPRYLGSDLSDYEINSLELKKIFDNAQIAIFEKI